MKKVRSATMAAIVMTVSLLVMADAMAQFGGGIPGGGMGGGRRGARMDKGGSPGTSRPAAQENVADLVEYRLAILQEDLNLTREEERAWAAYEERVKALAADISRERSRTQSTMGMKAVDQVNHAVDTARNRLAAWEEIASATKTLYDGLTEKQKALADERFPSIVSALSSAGSAGPANRPDGPRPGQAAGMDMK